MIKDCCKTTWVLLSILTATILYGTARAEYITLSPTNTEATIQSPNYPNNYENNVHVTWTIDIDVQGLASWNVEFIADAFSTEACCDKLTIEEPGGSDFEIMQTWYGSTLPEPYSTHVTQVRVKFVNDGSVTSSGFSIRVQLIILDCSTVELQYGVPENVVLPGNNRPCADIVSSPSICPGQCRLQIQVMALETQESAYCTSEYFSISDGYDNHAELVRFCGNSYPSGTFSTSRTNLTLAVHPRSSGNSPHAGVTITVVDASLTSDPCHGVGLSSSGDYTAVIHSRGFPYYYPKDGFCYNFDLTLGTAVDNTQTCVQFEGLSLGHQDCLYVYGGSAQLPDTTLATYCEVEELSDTLCHINMTELAIVFEPYLFSSSRGGFAIQVSSEPYECEDCPDHTIVIRHVNTEYPIQSPNYPNSYDNDLHMVWHVRVANSVPEPQTRKIYVIIDDFALESHTDCEFDYLAFDEPIADGSDVFQRTVTWCGADVPHTYTTLYNEAKITFRSDGSAAHHGFHIRLLVREAVCPRITLAPGITQDVRLFESAPQLMRNSCSIITINESLCTGDCGIQVQVSGLQTEYTQFCEYDYLAIYRGEQHGEDELIRFCGRGEVIFRNSDETLTLFLNIGNSSDAVSASVVLSAEYESDVDSCQGRATLSNSEDTYVVIGPEINSMDVPGYGGLCYLVDFTDMNKYTCVDMQGSDRDIGGCVSLSRANEPDTGMSTLAEHCDTELSDHIHHCFHNVTMLHVQLRNNGLENINGVRIEVYGVLEISISGEEDHGSSVGAVVGVLSVVIIIIIIILIVLIVTKKISIPTACPCTTSDTSTSNGRRAEQYAADNRGADHGATISTEAAETTPQASAPSYYELDRAHAGGQRPNNSNSAANAAATDDISYKPWMDDLPPSYDTLGF